MEVESERYRKYMHKKLLYFFPHKFDNPTDGIYTRVVTMLKYLNDAGFKVDMIFFQDVAIESSYVKEKGLVNEVYFVPSLYKRKFNLVDACLSFLKKVFYKIYPQIHDLVTPSLEQKLLDLCAANEYDIVLVTYAYWANIIKKLKLNGFSGRTIIDPTDFLTLQLFYSKPIRPYKIGSLFGSEIKLIKQYDDVLHISYDEMLLFSSFIPSSRHHFIPQFFQREPQLKKIDQFDYDIVFIGSSNIYNIEGLKWFFDDVYPLLDKCYKIAVAGSICKYVTIPESVNNLGFVDNIEQTYQQSRITICPLKRGTGMKIKVVESLSYGVPIVSTSKGLDGFYNKRPTGGILVADKPDQFAENINKLLTDDDFYLLQCELAINLYEGEFSVKSVFKRLDNVFSDNKG